MNDQIIDLLTTTPVGCLATICQDGSPWSTPLHVAHDDHWLYWFSREQAIHSQNIVFQPQVSFSLWSEDRSHGLAGLYLQSVAHKLSPEERHKAEAAYTAKFGDLPEAAQSWSAYRLKLGQIDESRSHGSLWYLHANEQAY